MARQIIKIAKQPYELKVGDQTFTLCMCGLSKNPPFCDHSHDHVQDELDDAIYVYDEKLNKIGAYEMAEDSGCCGGGCGGGHCGMDTAESECCGKKCDDNHCCNEECSCNLSADTQEGCCGGACCK